jgi:pyruvate dehydrogenase complex dehydrogenase (E1) component
MASRCFRYSSFTRCSASSASATSSGPQPISGRVLDRCHAGRTTLAGERLQHQDGSSHLVAATIPNCRAYDPSFAYEMAVILDHGARSMMEEGKDEFYYVTAMNENYDQPSMPENAEAGIIKGLYLLGRRTDRRRVSALSVCSARAPSFRKWPKRQRCWRPNGTFPPKSGA